MSKFILFPSSDFKYKNWARVIEKKGGKCMALDCSATLFPFKIVKNHFFVSTVDAFVFRYLNDRKSFVKSLILLISNLFTIYLCKILGIKIFWIIHNIDKETYEYHPKMTTSIKYILNRNSDKIFVTDPLLVEYAKKDGYDSNKIDWVSFGSNKSKDVDERNKKLYSQIKDYKLEITEKDNRKLVTGLCVSSSMPKYLHFLFAENLINYSDKNYKILLIIIGRLPENKKFENLVETYASNEQILHINENFPVAEHFISDQIDFIYRCIDDISIAYSIYVACQINKPIITNDVGFLPHLIRENDLGMVLPKPTRDTEYSIDIREFIDNFDDESLSQFLGKRTWDIAASKLLNDL